MSRSPAMVPQTRQVPDDNAGQRHRDAGHGNRALPPPPLPTGVTVPAETEDVAHGPPLDILSRRARR